MAIISCPECGKQVSDRAVSCPECGYPINSMSAAPAPAPVQQNTAEELNKLLMLARRAREGSDGKNAKRCYDQILEKDPGNWEAIFYSVYYEASECKIMYISSAANAVANCIYSTFAAIADLESKEEQGEALTQIISSAMTISWMFISGAISHYNQFSTTDNAYSECSSRVTAAGNIYAEIEAGLKKVFPAEKERLANFQMIYAEFLQSNERWYSGGSSAVTKTRLDREIALFYPEYGERKAREKELQSKIAALDSQIISLVTERKAPAGCLGWFFLPIGILMLFLGLTLMSLDGGSWPIWVSIPEIIIGVVCLQKKPSEEEVQANIKKKQQLREERSKLERELNSLK